MLCWQAGSTKCSAFEVLTPRQGERHCICRLLPEPQGGTRAAAGGIGRWCIPYVLREACLLGPIRTAAHRDKVKCFGFGSSSRASLPLSVSPPADQCMYRRSVAKVTTGRAGLGHTGVVDANGGPGAVGSLINGPSSNLTSQRPWMARQGGKGGGGTSACDALSIDKDSVRTRAVACRV